MRYETWKDNFESEFEAHRKANCRLIYPYQADYDKYHDSPNWVMVGDFCNFVRVGTLGIGAEITAKYEALMLRDDEVFEGFCLDEFERIRVYSSELRERHFSDEAKKIFEYSNMSVRYETLSETQKDIFFNALDKHLEAHKEDIDAIIAYIVKKQEKGW